MDEIITERSGSMLRVELNRPTKRNAMTSRMCDRHGRFDRRGSVAATPFAVLHRRSARVAAL
jgi:hypothetical protein